MARGNSELQHVELRGIRYRRYRHRHIDVDSDVDTDIDNF